MISKETKQTIILPTPDGLIDYRQRLLHHIIAKFVGQQTVISTGNEIHFHGTPDQAVKVQCIVDTCSEELDELIESRVYTFLLQKGLLVPKDFKVDIREVA